VGRQVALEEVYARNSFADMFLLSGYRDIMDSAVKRRAPNALGRGWRCIVAILIFVAAFVVLNVAAAIWGADSRHTHVDLA